jgi:hypothetical protein
MSSYVTVVNYDSLFKDCYPQPGERIKQWVVDMRREDAWARETCPRFDVPHHGEDLDDSEAAAGEFRECASVGLTSWLDIHHRECRFCDGMAQGLLALPEMVAWFAAMKARPPICADRDVLSDEIAEDISLRDNPLFSFIRKRSTP